MQKQMKEGGAEKYLPRKNSRHTRGRPCGGALDSSSRGRLPLAIGKITMTKKTVSTSLFSFSSHALSSLCFFRELAGNSIVGDEAAGRKGLNKLASSLLDGSRVKRRLETRAGAHRPLCGSRRDASAYGCVLHNFN
jgi:hypothetical protein